ncbi:MAG: DUF1848 domain-containing protein [Rectinemataceae bacterium]|jgi:hypothetical protein
MIVSASRRCDIPAYNADWLMERIEAGYAEVRNPFDARRSTRVSLVPEDVDFLVLWTRDPRPIAPRMRELDDRGIRSYVQMTITGYPASIEPGAPGFDEAIRALCELSDAIGNRRVLWRYDPIFVAEGLDADFHRRSFERIASGIEGRTERVTLSLLDEYAGTASRLARSGHPGALFGSPRGASQASAPPAPYPALLSELAAIAKSRGILPLACAEPYDLSALGIEAGACVDAALAASLWGLEIPPRKNSGQRRACRCARSIDIGTYGTCLRSCAYCYANRDMLGVSHYHRKS